MATKETSASEVLLEDVRLSYAHLDEAEASVANGPKKYSASFIIDPKSESGKKVLAKAKAAFRAACEGEKKWAGKVDKIVPAIDADRKALRNGDSITNEEGDTPEEYQGMFVVKATRPEKQKRPVVLSRRKEKVEPGDEQFPYSGCYVDAVVRFYTITDKDKGGNGIFCGLEAVRFRRDGEAFGNSRSVDPDAFEDLDDDDENFNGGGSSDDGDDLV